MDVLLTKIKKAAENLRQLRLRAESEEERIRVLVRKFLAPHGSIRLVAAELGISAQYLCDIYKGRRKISDEVLRRIREL